MRRLGVLLGTVAVAAFVLALAGCGSSGSDSTSAQVAQVQAETRVADAKKQAEAERIAERQEAAKQTREEAAEVRAGAVAEREQAEQEVVEAEEAEAAQEEAEEEADPGSVSRAEYGKKWPLKVAGGELSCEGSEGFGAVVFTAPDGTEYGVNGTALDDGFREIEPIWSFEPGMAKYELRIDIGPLLDRGLSLCE